MAFSYLTGRNIYRSQRAQTMNEIKRYKTVEFSRQRKEAVIIQQEI